MFIEGLVVQVMKSDCICLCNLIITDTTDDVIEHENIEVVQKT